MSILAETLTPSHGAPSALDELFSKDPLKLTDQDLDKIISFMREERKKWLVQEATKKTKKAKAPSNITAGDLFDEGN